MMKPITAEMLKGSNSRYFPKSLLFGTVLAVTLAGGLLNPLKAQEQSSTVSALSSSTINLLTTTGTVRAKAQPDECFVGIGENKSLGKPPCSVGQARVNPAYVWAMASAGNNVFFGTVANTLCLVQGTILSPSTAISFDTPYQTNAWVCEFGKSAYVPPLPAGIGDFRPPQMFVYNVNTKGLTEITPTSDPRVAATLGIRAAAMLTDGHILFAGPAITNNAINFFVFDATSQAYLGSFSLPGYNDIRKFVSYQGYLYTAVSNVGGGGSVLKWNNSYLTGCAFCPSFDVVGKLTGEGAYIASHQGRLYVSTWPNGLDVASLFMSPLIPSTGGLTTSQAANWTKVWSSNQYEPDLAVVRTYATGALESFGGYLYWGTMHVPYASTIAALEAYGTPQTTLESASLLLGSFRTLAIFRGQNLDSSTPQIDLLYGASQLPSYQPGANGSYGTWKLVPNVSHYTPLYGPSGFGNPFNNYTWTMEIWGGRLWVGTMDWSYVFDETLPLLLQTLGITAPPITSASIGGVLPFYGADLWTFINSHTPAIPESIDGVGNYLNYGVRNMLPYSASQLFLGMADGDGNLKTDPTSKMGGWELIELNPRN